MARKVSPPQYRLHKATGQAYTRINGRMIYLGSYDSPDSRQKYATIVSDWSAGNLDQYGKSVSISRLCVAFVKHSETYYVKNGKPTSQLAVIRSALRHFNEHFGHMGADRFLPKHLEQMQQHYLRLDLCRYTVNQYVNIIRQAFRFAVTKGSVPAATWQSLLAVRHLQRGRTPAREMSIVEPVPPLRVIATLRHLGPVVRAMIRLQYVTGMRPGEVCMMRVKDIDRSGDVWRYAPEGHKTVHHGKKRMILLGRKAQRILQPYLNRTPDSFVFSPTETRDGRRDELVHRAHFPDGYNRTSYRRAINRACIANGIPDWAPNQLRHTFATIIRKRYGLEAAQVLLGHTKADITEVYAERDATLAEKVAREVG
ncbi:MAG: site-specific integrase [Planctomycetaceae bacterium]|nr:site-specific integrase [Planctomycetaceae bacterium]